MPGSIGLMNMYFKDELGNANMIFNRTKQSCCFFFFSYKKSWVKNYRFLVNMCV